MKIIAYYDLEGNIQSLIGVEAAEGALAMRVPKPGLFAAVVDIEGLELTADALDPEVLTEIAGRYMVEAPLPRLTLIKKTG